MITELDMKTDFDQRCVPKWYQNISAVRKTSARFFKEINPLKTKNNMNYISTFNSFHVVNIFHLSYENKSVSAVQETITVCCDINMTLINTIWGQNVEFSVFNLVVHKVTTEL
jgi:hypothetical protein